MNSRILPIAMTKQHNILHILLPLLLLLLLDSTLSFSVPKQQQRKSPYCTSSLDCPASHCCTETPIGHKLCVPYEKQGETCFFRSRSPTCGCAPGLKCISTMPMEEGHWSHDFVCAKVRPFMFYKLLPYLDDSINDVESR